MSPTAAPAAPSDATASAPKAAPPTLPPHTWALTLTGEPDALMRVLSILRRRRWRVTGVHFELGDAHRPHTRLRLSARPTGGRPHAMDAWLAGLPDVLSVDRER